MRRSPVRRSKEFDRFAAASPPGMPYGLPALSALEQRAIAGWLEAGVASCGSARAVAARR